ncbi:MAG: sensor histidine kinase [Anaerolineaceae bacterium]|nr:sensor histidine kinase [Anaerolineaceae bacterium]
MTEKKNSSAIEPGILPLFRIFVGVQLAVMLWNWFSSLRTPRFILLGRFPQLTQWFQEKQANAGIYLLVAAFLALFMVYMLVPQFRRWLGKYYLPIALTLQVVIIIVAVDLLTLNRLNNQLVFDFGSRSWQLFFFLFFPVILASWQYRFSQVLLLILFTTLVELLFFLLIRNAPAFHFGASSAFLLGRSLLYIFIAYVVSHLMHQQRTLRASLESANQKLKDYVSTQDALATARERNRLSRELHDTLAHTLSALVIHLEAANIEAKSDPAKAQQEMESITQQARSGLNEARRAIRSLRAAPLEEMGLLLALQEAVKEAAIRGGFEPHLTLPSTLPYLPTEVENEVYRVAVEAIQNVALHAHAQNLTLKLSATSRILNLLVQDDGTGFDLHKVDGQTHFGLLGLRERADLHGADLQVNSMPGSGTSVSFQIEVPK